MLVRAGVVVVWWVGFLMGGVMYQNKIRDRGCAVRRCSGDRPRGGGRREREREGIEGAIGPTGGRGLKQHGPGGSARCTGRGVLPRGKAASACQLANFSTCWEVGELAGQAEGARAGGCDEV